jgi:spermidine dehydrogenase
MLGKSGFVGERDVASITVNRWAHGYACGGNDLFDEPVTGVEPPPWVRARQRIGRISIANSDAAGVSLTQAAFDQADRAVRELISDVLRPQFYYLNPEQG